MSKKRTPDQEISETQSAVAEPDAAEPGAADAVAGEAEGKPTFAERVGKREWRPAPDPFGIVHDDQTGVHLLRSNRKGRMEIQFGDGSAQHKPSPAVLEKMRSSPGWSWKSADRVWALPFTEDSVRTKHIEGETLFHELNEMIRQEKGIGASPEVPF